MWEVIYSDKTLNKRITQTFWSKKEAYKFVKKINRDKNMILLAIYNNTYLYD